MSGPRGFSMSVKIDRIGLCAQCCHAESIESAKGSTFYLCGLSKTDPRFPKYPRLPVLSCAGFEQLNEGKGTAEQPEEK